MQISLNTPNYQARTSPMAKKPTAQPSFTGASQLFAPISRIGDKCTDGIARGIARIFESPLLGNIVNNIKDSKMIITHLMVAESALTSALYVRQTLNNKKLDKQHRNTLAINQGLVFGVSTALTYTLDKSIAKWADRMACRFKAVNPMLDAKKLDKCLDGLQVAKSLVIIGFIYRYFSPVVVTPIANWLGKKVQEKSAAKKAAAAGQTPQVAQAPTAPKAAQPNPLTSTSSDKPAESKSTNLLADFKAAINKLKDDDHDDDHDDHHDD